MPRTSWMAQFISQVLRDTYVRQPILKAVYALKRLSKNSHG